jgi:hypothetical protein
MGPFAPEPPLPLTALAEAGSGGTGGGFDFLESLLIDIPFMEKVRDLFPFRDKDIERFRLTDFCTGFPSATEKDVVELEAFRCG